ncbi:uncharacterized protein STEHIDRAFT_170270 [Stereum hirsutum FP-91666 SS1]|uniref:uncharacterized protein n=1 Tax=Stereum hirsutum (strain FP-91666) TaxID=721885 RepID=UPI0004449A60|nr:uncharacterized protein STEHIDRAFT_170270 [Stereum hirsutum FP-91666 SS1]EIM83780.1 hypothetical protein STEHIDRAFT_170270 [Stereum hirsutum FP-91666 SS1]
MAAGDPYHVVLRIRYKGLKMLKIRDCPTHNSVRGRDQMSELKNMLRKDMDSTSLRLGSSLPKKDKIFLSGDFGDAVEAHYETQKGNCMVIALQRGIGSMDAKKLEKLSIISVELFEIKCTRSGSELPLDPRDVPTFSSYNGIPPPVEVFKPRQTGSYATYPYARVSSTSKSSPSDQSPSVAKDEKDKNGKSTPTPTGPDLSRAVTNAPTGPRSNALGVSFFFDQPKLAFAGNATSTTAATSKDVEGKTVKQAKEPFVLALKKDAKALGVVEEPNTHVHATSKVPTVVPVSTSSTPFEQQYPNATSDPRKRVKLCISMTTNPPESDPSSSQETQFRAHSPSTSSSSQSQGTAETSPPPQSENSNDAGKTDGATRSHHVFGVASYVPSATFSSKASSSQTPSSSSSNITLAPPPSTGPPSSTLTASSASISTVPLPSTSNPSSQWAPKFKKPRPNLDPIAEVAGRASERAGPEELLGMIGRFRKQHESNSADATLSRNSNFVLVGRRPDSRSTRSSEGSELRQTRTEPHASSSTPAPLDHEHPIVSDRDCVQAEDEDRLHQEAGHPLSRISDSCRIPDQDVVDTTKVEVEVEVADEQHRRMRDVRALLGRLPPELEGLLRAYYRGEDQRGAEDCGSSRSQPQLHSPSPLRPQENQDECVWESERHTLKRKAAQAEEECERLRGEVKRRRMENDDVRRFVRKVMDEEGLCGPGAGLGAKESGQKQVIARPRKRIRSGSENGEVVEIDVEDEAVRDGLYGDVAMEDGEVDEENNDDNGDIMTDLKILHSTLTSLHTSLSFEKSARRAAQVRLRRTEDALKDVERECREPFVVPALLQAFLGVSRMTDRVME